MSAPGPAARLLQLVDEAGTRGVTLGEARAHVAVPSRVFDDVLARMLEAGRGWQSTDGQLYSTAPFEPSST